MIKNFLDGLEYKDRQLSRINQILAFGSDTNVIDNCYGYQQVVRKMVLEVLAEKVLSKRFSEDEAILIAHRILRENLKSMLKE